MASIMEAVPTAAPASKAPAAERPAGGQDQVSVRIDNRQTIDAALRELEENVLRRAFEIFEGNGAQPGRALDDWLAAERELLWLPRAELEDRGDHYVVRLDVAGMLPAELDLRVTADGLLLRGERQRGRVRDRGGVQWTEFSEGRLCRHLPFPTPVDPASARATYRHGILRVTASKAGGTLAGREVPIGTAAPDRRPAA